MCCSGRSWEASCELSFVFPRHGRASHAGASTDRSPEGSICSTLQEIGRETKEIVREIVPVAGAKDQENLKANEAPGQVCSNSASLCVPLRSPMAAGCETGCENC